MLICEDIQKIKETLVRIIDCNSSIWSWIR